MTVTAITATATATRLQESPLDPRTAVRNERHPAGTREIGQGADEQMHSAHRLEPFAPHDTQMLQIALTPAPIASHEVG